VARLVGFYLALTTFALALALPQMLKSSYVSPWTGGAQGLYLDRPGAPLRLPVTPDQWWYFVTLGMLALLLWMTHNLIAGRIGRAIRAMRDDPIAALVMGIDVTRYTALTFGVGRRTRPSPARSPRSFSISSHPRASPTGSRSSFWWARCSAA
jgi:branched-chain amino acid transport system permease protein